MCRLGKVMPQHTEELELFDMADQFIDVANRLVEEHGQELGRVGAAIRYAAARFNAHEASYKSDDLEADKEDALSWFTEQYRKMLIDNIDEHIEMALERNEKNT